ncbi:hypothetical protein NC651_035076 [Populus alba x Populus x berolinensis]|nr:hypothetical protein NC651_035076 [Populus alba x Populus x berolinensis]
MKEMIVIEERGRLEFIVGLLIMREADSSGLGFIGINGVYGLARLWWKRDVGCHLLKTVMVLDGGKGEEKWWPKFGLVFYRRDDEDDDLSSFFNFILFYFSSFLFVFFSPS